MAPFSEFLEPMVELLKLVVRPEQELGALMASILWKRLPHLLLGKIMTIAGIQLADISEAREVALRDDTSTHALVREFLTRYADARNRKLETLAAFEAVAQGSENSSRQPWIRESLHDFTSRRIDTCALSRRAFIDTNLCVYRHDRREPTKDERSRAGAGTAGRSTRL